MQFQNLKMKLGELNEARNVVSHTGTNDYLTDELCLEFLATARGLLMLGTPTFQEFRPLHTRQFEGIEFTKMKTS